MASLIKILVVVLALIVAILVSLVQRLKAVVLFEETMHCQEERWKITND